MPFIKDQFIDKIREQADIADVISRYAGLKKKGKHLFCLSPFADEKTASFCIIFV
jgi:DNA primase